MQRRLYSLLALIVFFTCTVMAQVTTSSLNGKVVAGKDIVVGATVSAVHVPSGTRYNAVTNIDGRYTIQGMRVGGPYTITIDYIGYKDAVYKNISLALGEPQVINANLQEDAKELGEVTVTGKTVRGGNGASSNFSHQQIENAPTVDRNIYDVAKLSPLVNANKNGGITIAGTNNRYNSFQIDGMVANDVFGLSPSGTNGGQSGANPISMDAIEQIQVAASPFDVTQSGFTGGAINAITKSGTNKFTGTAYTYYTDENMYGRWSQYYDKKQKLSDETTKTYGFTLGGPILKDKLFFFTSLEHKKDLYPSQYYASDNYFITPAIAQQLAQHYYDVTGIQQTYGPRDITTDGLSLLGRLDWNINAKNHFSLRYQGNFSYEDVYGSSAYAYYFNESGYKMKNKTNSFVAELTSHLNDNLYNEFRAGVTFVRDHREPGIQGPTIYITTKNAGIDMGTEYSSGVNILNQNIYTLEDNLSIYSGNHTFTLGTHNEVYNLKNGFIQAANGEWVYSDYNAFLNDQASSFVYKYSDPSVTGTSRWATPFKSGIFGIYAQDKWDISTRFSLTYGLRFDVPFYFNKPSTNDDFNASSYAEQYGVSVGRRPASSIMASPRAGFHWYLNDSHRSLLRGGAGIFNGRAPFVWIENVWANTGVEMKGGTIYSSTNKATGATTWAPSFSQYGSKDPLAVLQSASSSADKPVINTIDHKFKYPQAFRANIALEQQLPAGIKMTLEALYTKDINNIWYENLALIDNGSKVYAVPGVDNSATTYYSKNAGSYNAIINMANTSKGYSYSLSAKFDKSFDFGLDLMASYTFGHSKSVNDGTSSVATSNWGYYYSVDPNQKSMSYSMFDIPQRIQFQANYNSKMYGGNHWQSHVSLTYNGYSGQRYSLTMSDAQSSSFNGDYQKGNSLLYIPTDDELSKMNFTSESDRTSFKNWIEGDKYAKDHRGQYAIRNSNMAPWENHFDFHFAQDFFYLPARGSKVSLIFDILNVGNLLNKHWGEYYAGSYNYDILQVTNVSQTSTGVYVPTYSYAGNSPKLSDYSSRWHMQLGLRVTF